MVRVPKDIPVLNDIPRTPDRSYLYALATRFGEGIDDNLAVSYFLPDTKQAQEALEALCVRGASYPSSGFPSFWERREGDYEQRAARYEAAASQVGLAAVPTPFQRGTSLEGIKLYFEVLCTVDLRRVSGKETAPLSLRELFELHTKTVRSLTAGDAYVLPETVVGVAGAGSLARSA